MVQTLQKSAAQILKVDESLGLVFGYSIVCLEDGEEYWDLQDQHIPEDAMLKAATDFMLESRVAGEQHIEKAGTVVFAFPMTTEIAKALDIEVKKTGLLIAIKPDDDEILKKFKSGELTGFSIGGEKEEVETVNG